MYVYFFVFGKRDRRQDDRGHSHSGDYVFHSVRGEWRGAGLSREEITCILSLLGDLRGCASYGPGRRQIHSYFCDLHCGRKEHPGAGWLALSETLIPFSPPYAHGSLSRCLIGSGRPFSWSFPLRFRSDCFSARFMAGTRQGSLVFTVFGFFCFNSGPGDAGIGSPERLSACTLFIRAVYFFSFLSQV